MFFNNLLKSGWLHALYIGIFAYTFASVASKIIASVLESNVFVYSMFYFLSSSFILLLVAGPGKLSIETLKRIETWLYAINQILVQVLAVVIVVYVSATQGVGLFRLSSCIALLFSLLFLGQKTNKIELLGFMLTLTGIFMILKYVELPIEQKAFLIVLLILRSLAHAGQKFIAELHKTNRKASNFKDQIRVTGFIMFVASFMMLCTLLVIAYFKSIHDLSFLSAFPNFADFFNFKALLLAFVVGGVIISTSKYCEFYAGKTIGAKYLTSVLSLQIIFVYLLEDLLVKFNLMNPLTFTKVDVIALSLILFGNLIVSLAGFFSDIKFIKKGEKRDTLENMDDNFVESQKDFDIVRLNLTNLKALYDGDSKKLAEDMEIDRVTLDNIINYELEEIKLSKKIAKKINHFASHNVALKDKLTKAYNRYSLTNKTEELFKNNTEFKIYLLDLNKFKPINDTHGHEAGDVVLVETVKRLQSIKEFTEGVFRVGGDEFVLVQSENVEKDLTKTIAEEVEKPIVYNDLSLEISTSVGLVQSENDTDLEQMLALADQRMYIDKKENGGGR